MGQEGARRPRGPGARGPGAVDGQRCGLRAHRVGSQGAGGPFTDGAALKSPRAGRAPAEGRDRAREQLEACSCVKTASAKPKSAPGHP